MAGYILLLGAPRSRSRQMAGLRLSYVYAGKNMICATYILICPPIKLISCINVRCPQHTPIGALTVQVSVVEAVGLGLASNPLGICIFLGKDLALQVALDLVDPAGVLVYQGQQQAVA